MADESKAENIKLNQRALGCFVESFELMVGEARESAIELIERDPHHGRLVAIALHHQNLAAKPIIEIFRAVVAEIVKDALARTKAKEGGKEGTLPPPLRLDALDAPLKITIQDQEALNGAMNAICGEYDDLQQVRNKLLHATWFIGYDPKGEEIEIEKYTASATGLSRVMTVPKTRTELEYLTKRCDVTRSWIAAVHACLGGPFLVQETFKRDSNGWRLVIGQTKKPLLGKGPPAQA
jgi:hypothetical protein